LKVSSPQALFCFGDGTQIESIPHRTLRLKSFFPPNTRVSRIEGGLCTNLSASNLNGYPTVEVPSDGGAIIIYLDDTDFISVIPMANMRDRKSCLLFHSFCRKERKCRTRSAKRQGSAGGHFVPSEGPVPVSIGTVSRKRPDGLTRHLIFKHRNSTGCQSSCVYVVGTKKPVESVYYASVYGDTRTHRMTSNEKRSMLSRDRAFRLIEIEIMKTRVQSLLLMEAKQELEDLKTSASKVLGNRNTVNQWRMFDANLSDGDIVLLEYSLSTGEMRNHYPAACHRDGNTSHHLETMYYGSYEEGEGGYALLHFPLHGFVLKIPVGSHAVHCTLRNTYHASDESRGVTNFVKLSGPKPVFG
jgi:hypothetical protein